MSYRTKLYEDYAGIFGSHEQNNEDVEGEHRDGERDVEGLTRAEVRAEIEEEKRRKKWNWYNLLYHIAKGDILKIEQLTKLNLLFLLTHKGYEIENKKIYEFYEFRRFNMNLQ